MRGKLSVILPRLFVVTAACGTGVKGESPAGTAAPAIAVNSIAAVERPIRRFLEVTGTMAAEEEAEVAAEVYQLHRLAPVRAEVEGHQSQPQQAPSKSSSAGITSYAELPEMIKSP